MKILSAQEIAAADAGHVAQYNYSSRMLMENAGREACALILKWYTRELKRGVVVLCGAGNNGGDGYVVAREIKRAGFEVYVIAIKTSADLKGDAKLNAELWSKFGGATSLFPKDINHAQTLLKQAGLVVDALLGTGFRGQVQDPVATLIKEVEINCGNIPVVALDIPSGVDASTGAVDKVCINADLTISFQVPKLGHLLFPGSSRVGRLLVVDVGIELAAEVFSGSSRELLQESELSALAAQCLNLPSTGHKGTRGHVLVIAGSAGKIGAGKLSALAALRAGSGLVTLALPGALRAVLEGELEEVMCLALGKSEDYHGIDNSELEHALSKKSAVLVGPGMGKNCSGFLQQVFESVTADNSPIVIDADALNEISESAELRACIPKGAVLTPHPGEMCRLMSCAIKDIEQARIDYAEKLAQELQVIVILKGARSVIASPGKTYLSPFASVALGTAGSGDVLGGMIAGLCGRGVPALEACLLAVYAHGLAGEAAEEYFSGGPGVIASEIAKEAACVLNTLADSSKVELLAPGHPIEIEL